MNKILNFYIVIDKLIFYKLNNDKIYFIIINEYLKTCKSALELTIFIYIIFLISFITL